MVQNNSMRLDHVSYVTSHDQLADTVQRLGSRLGTTFVDGGIHPRFGTRNFTAPLLDGKYIEVVCPLDHPATPYDWAVGLNKIFTSSKLISLDADGHTGQGRGSACVDNAVDIYLLQGKSPKKNLSCQL